ncbi:MAG: hypothetical protein B5M52_02455 [Helicobacteraceae bacterium 4484_230]|nr:MAG: hypothetical protein B5M52_02455 [Helicobacteraceae bacterium 4484_230]
MIIAFDISNLSVLFIAAFLVSATGAYLLSKIVIEPIREHFEQLEKFSKETLHELNLPINTITTNVKMLRKSNHDEKSLKRLNRIEMACEMLQKRYNELDYLIKRQIQKELIEPFDAKELIEERVMILKEIYPSAKFNTDLDSLSLKMDKMGFSKTIDNLIDNAIKYSATPATVNITLHDSELRISDKGVGMDDMELLRIFDRYYQSDAATPGFGIGLGLVKDYCDRHRIMLHVESKKGKGTSMILDLKRVERP